MIMDAFQPLCYNTRKRQERFSTNERRLAQAVDEWAAKHREELVRDIMELVRIPSVTGEDGCAQVLDRLQEMADRLGFRTERDENYSVSILHSGAVEECELGMLGHLDVVPAGNGWRYAPFKAEEKDGWLIGRGASDNKGPVVMCLYVLRCLQDLGIALRSSVRLIAGTREETDMEDVRRYLRTHEPPAFTLNCDGAWAGCIGEKGIFEADLTLELNGSSLNSFEGGTVSNAVPDAACAVLIHADPFVPEAAETAYRGLRIENTDHQTRLHMTGKAAHCCTPARGENAVLLLVNALCDSGLVQELEPFKHCFPDCFGTGLRINHEDAVSGKTTCTVTTAHMDQGILHLHINARTAVTQRGDQLLAALKKRLDKLGIGLENVRWDQPRLDSPKQPEIQLLLNTCKTFLDSKAKPYVMGGATHSRMFPRSLPFGPENIDPRRKRPFGRAHEADEAVCIDDLLSAVKVYVIVLVRLDEYFQKQ